MRVMVIGAAPHSLGAAIVKTANFRFPSVEVLAAGIQDEAYYLDVTERGDVWDTLMAAQPSHVVVTTGVNVGAKVGHNDYISTLEQSLNTNTIGVMCVLDEWLRVKPNVDPVEPQAFVAISSNSATIARTGSAAYCASKAALSMALRCAARELAGAPLVYGYEFGLLAGTPMTAITEQRFGPTQTRMPGAPKGLSASDAADQIVNDLMHPWHGLNGSLLRLDAGEQ